MGRRTPDKRTLQVNDFTPWQGAHSDRKGSCNRLRVHPEKPEVSFWHPKYSWCNTTACLLEREEGILSTCCSDMFSKQQDELDDDQWTTNTSTDLSVRESLLEVVGWCHTWLPKSRKAHLVDELSDDVCRWTESGNSLNGISLDLSPIPLAWCWQAQGSTDFEMTRLEFRQCYRLISTVDAPFQKKTFVCNTHCELFCFSHKCQAFPATHTLSIPQTPITFIHSLSLVHCLSECVCVLPVRPVFCFVTAVENSLHHASLYITTICSN